jgi:hypothetical protein
MNLVVQVDHARRGHDGPQLQRHWFVRGLEERGSAAEQDRDLVDGSGPVM